MKNGTIYKRTLPLALRRMLITGGSLLLALVLIAAAFLLTENNEELCLIVTGVAALIALIGVGLVARYIGYLYKAGQIAVVTEAVTTGELPDDVVAEGKAQVKSRFAATSVYFVIERLISGITNQLTNAITSASKGIGGAIGGEQAKDAAGAVGTAFSVIVSVILSYMNACCLGWVFYKKDQNAFKSTCDGAVIYFQNWKTLLKNVGKVLLIALASLIVIGGPFFLLFYTLLGNSAAFGGIARELAEVVETDPATMLMIMCGVLAFIVWSILHTAFVEPYILISVLRRYMEAGIQNPPTVDPYGKLCKLSKSFKKAFEKSEQTTAAEA